MLIFSNGYEFNYGSGAQGKLAPAAVPSREQLFTATSLCFLGVVDRSVSVLLPHQPDSAFLEYLDRTGALPNLIVPGARSRSLSEAAISDLAVRAAIRDAQPAAVVSWGYTPEFAAACETLELNDIWRNTQPRTSVAQAVSVLDSKVGSSSFLDRVVADLANVRRPKWRRLDCASPDWRNEFDAIVREWGAVIVKPNRSWAGKGTVAVRNNADYADAIAHLEQALAAPWADRALIVEQLVGDANNITLSADYCAPLFKAGPTVQVGYVRQTGFRCIGASYGASKPPFAAEMESVIWKCADALADIGYCGWFDVDFVSDDVAVWPTEVNIRMTGGTVQMLALEALIGTDWATQFDAVWEDNIVLNAGPRSLGALVAFDRELSADGCRVFAVNYDARSNGSAVSLVSAAPTAAQATANLAAAVGVMNAALESLAETQPVNRAEGG